MMKHFLVVMMIAQAKPQWVPAPVQNFPLTGSAHVTGQGEDLPISSGQIQMQGEEILKANLNVASGEKSESRLNFDHIAKTAEGLFSFAGQLNKGDKTEIVEAPIKIKNSDQEITGDGTFKIPNSPDLEIHFRGEKHPATSGW